MAPGGSTRDFPAFVHSLPEVDLGHGGLRGWLLRGDHGSVLYWEALTEVTLPEHGHAECWGVVVDGRMELTVDGYTRIQARSDLYRIPAQVRHRVRVFPGFRGVEHVSDPGLFLVRKR